MSEDSSPSMRKVAALWAVGGLVIGALAVFFAMQGRDASPEAEPPRAAASMPKSATPEPEAAPEGAGADPSVEPAAAEGAAPGDPPAPPTTGPALSPPTELRGPAPTGPLAGSGTEPFQPPGPDAVLRSPEVLLVRMNVYTSDPDAARAAVEAFVQTLGGQTRAFTDFGIADREPAEGLLILVPDKHVDQTVKFVQARSGNVAEQSWLASPQSRQARLDDETQTALFALKAKRQRLLVKYLNDADPVREVEEAISQAEAALRRLRIAEAEQSLAALKVTFGPRG